MFLGLPLFRWPCGFQSRACFVILLSFFRNVWPIHFHAIVQQMANVGKKCLTRWRGKIFSLMSYRKNVRLHISQLIRFSIACCSYQDFLDRGLLLTRKLLNQGFLLVKLKSSLRKFYGRHHDLVDRYGISASQMTTDMFHLSWTLPCPFLVHDLSPVCN
jgi:hypothetical protein